jgi:multidrug efflux system membrane fusion protein
VDSKLMKTLIRCVIGAVLLLLGGFGFRAYTSKSAQAKATAGKEAAAAADRVVPVLAVPVVQRDMPIYLEGLGNVLASATVTVHTQVDGRIDRIAFVEGQEVKKGDLLAQIDPRPFQTQLASANAALARDQAQLAGAEKNLERYTELRQSGLSTQQQLDDQTALVAQLKGTIGADQAAIASARLSLDYARITSPIDGVTGIRLIDQGNLAHVADPGGIVVITTLDPIAVIFTLPQDNLDAIAKELSTGAVAVEAMSRDGVTKLASGQLALIDNQINQATATIKLKALFSNPKRVLWPNAFVKTRLLLSTRKNALVIPAAVVQHGPQGTFAYVVDQDQKAAVRPVVVDVTEGDSVIVASGLSAGEQVVLDGQSQLKPGAKVAPRPPSAPAASGAPSAGPAAPPFGSGRAPEGKEGRKGAPAGSKP